MTFAYILSIDYSTRTIISVKEENVKNKSIKNVHFYGTIKYVVGESVHRAACCWERSESNGYCSHTTVPRGVLGLMAPKSRVMQREMMQYASFLCIAQRVTGNGVNSNSNEDCFTAKYQLYLLKKFLYDMMVRTMIFEPGNTSDLQIS